MSNVRGRGMMCAFDLPDQAARDALVTRLREEHSVLVLPCGPRSVRLRPALNIPEPDLDHGLAALSAAL
jgi:L-lysine 6-transaminase